MAIFLEILGGTDQGLRYKIEPGMTLGRSQADILLKDPKVSSTHAEIALNPQNHMIIRDLDSSNGLHINGQRVKKVTLYPGVIFEVGRTLFKVLVVEDALVEDFSHVIAWRSTIAKALEDFPYDIIESENVPQSFSPALKLLFIQGMQSEQQFFLGYGPRVAGSRSLDIELLDSRAPEYAFKLLPGPGMVEFRPLAEGVLLNGQKVASAMLNDGDLIAIGETVIRIQYS